MSDLKVLQYKRMLEERRGHNYQYPTHEQQLKNDALGYKHYVFADGKIDTMSELCAIDIVNLYRKINYFSRIVCYPNDITGLKCFSVIYRKKRK